MSEYSPVRIMSPGEQRQEMLAALMEGDTETAVENFLAIVPELNDPNFDTRIHDACNVYQGLGKAAQWGIALAVWSVYVMYSKTAPEKVREYIARYFAGSSHNGYAAFMRNVKACEMWMPGECARRMQSAGMMIEERPVVKQLVDSGVDDRRIEGLGISIHRELAYVDDPEAQERIIEVAKAADVPGEGFRTAVRRGIREYLNAGRIPVDKWSVMAEAYVDRIVHGRTNPEIAQFCGMLVARLREEGKVRLLEEALQRARQA